MADPYASYASWAPGTVNNAAVVVPSDTADLPIVATMLGIGVGGLIKVTTAGGQTVSLTVTPMYLVPVRVVRVWATGTTASGIVALW